MPYPSCIVHSFVRTKPPIAIVRAQEAQLARRLFRVLSFGAEIRKAPGHARSTTGFWLSLERLSSALNCGDLLREESARPANAVGRAQKAHGSTELFAPKRTSGYEESTR